MTKLEQIIENTIRDAGNGSRPPKVAILLTACYALVIVGLIGVGIRESIGSFNQPSPRPFETMLAFIYVVAAVAIGLAVWPLKGRLLLTVTIFVLAVAFAVAITRTRAGLALLVLCWLILLARAVGVRIMKFIARDAETCGLERAVFGTAIGFGAITLLAYGIGMIGFLYRSVLFAVLACLTLVLLPRRKHLWDQLLQRLAPVPAIKLVTRTADLRLLAFVIASAVISFCPAFIWALAPETGFDALNYQLGIPQVYVENHAVVEVSYSFWSYLLGSNGMLYSLALSLTGQPLPQLIHLTFGVLLALITFLFGRRCANARVGLIAAALVYTLPLVSTSSGHAGVDLIVAVHAFGAIYAASVWFETAENGWLTIAGLMGGFGLAGKLNAVAVLIPLTLVVIYRIASKSRSWKERASSLLRLVIPVSLISAPMFVTRLTWTGNPVFPLLNHLFRSPYWPAINETFNFHDYGEGANLASLFSLPWNLTTHAERFAEGPGGILGSLPLLGLAGFVLLARRERRRFIWPAVVILAGGILVWFQTAQNARFLLMFLPIIAVTAALVLEAFYQRIPPIATNVGVRVVALSVGLCVLVASGLVTTKVGAPIPGCVPYRYFLGLETREQFLSRILPVYDAFSYLNREAPHSKVLCIGNEFRLYTTAQIEGTSGGLEAAKVLGITDRSHLSQFLNDRHYNYVLVNKTAVQSMRGVGALPVLRNDLLLSCTRLTFARNNVDVYQVEPVGTSWPKPANLIENCSFEKTGEHGVPLGWVAYGAPIVDRTGGRSRTGVTGVRASSSGGLFTLVLAEPGQPYTVSHWSRAERPAQFARIQINWLANDLSLLDVSISVVEGELEWKWHELSATAPERAVYAQVYVSVHEESEVWFDDYAFVQGSAASLPQYCDPERQAKGKTLP